MDWITGTLSFFVGALLSAVYAGYAMAGLRRELEGWRSKHESALLERAKFESEAARVPGLVTRIEAVLTELSQAKADNAQAQARREEQARAHEREVAELKDLRGGIDEELKQLTAEALRANQGAFLELANQVFEKHKTGADTEFAARQSAVADLVSPLAEALKGLREETQQLERNRAQAYGSLSGELRAVAETQNAVRAETTRLVQALRASPKTRGRWGEHTLQNVLELSGLSPYCDFSTEETIDRPDSRIRPDVVIRLPGGRHLVVDAKTSTAAYLDAIEATVDADRERHLVLHAAQTREHMRKLAAKSYWEALTVTPDFVVMFIPGDNFYSAAVERDPALFEDAVAQRVIIVTPSTLIALAKAVAFGWRQEKVAENAQHVHDLGRELYKRMTVMAEHIQGCGGSLAKAVKGFNDFVGSLEHSVMPQVRRFNELEVEGTATAIPVLTHIDTEPRLLRTDRDFAKQLGVSANSNTETEQRPAA
jgi:DNA recombination protein RmuC